MAPISRTQASINTARSAQSQVGNLDKDYQAAVGELSSASDLNGKLVARSAQIAGQLVELKKHPGRNAAKIKDLEWQQTQLPAAFKLQGERVNAAISKVGTASTKLLDGEAKALAAAKTANTTAVMSGEAIPFEKAVYVDSVDDAASLSKSDQAALMGAPAPLTPGEALKGDVNRLKLAVNAGHGPEALRDLLAGTEPANQAALLEAVKAQLPGIAGAALAPSNSASNAGFSYLKAIEGASPEAKAALIKAMADASPSGDLEGTSLGAAVKQAVDKGQLFGPAMELIKGLNAAGKPRAADSIARISANALPALREDFDAKAKVANKLQGELAMLNTGFGELMSPAQKAKAINAFRANHKEEFEDYEKAGAKLSGALDAMKSLDIKSGPKNAYEIRKGADLVRENGFAKAGGQDMAGTILLQAEALKLAEELPQLTQTKAGTEAMQAALKEQKAGQPSFLDSAAKVVGTSKELTETVAKAVASGIGQLAMRGGIITKADMYLVLEKNSKMLGVSQAQVDELSEAFTGATDAAGTEKLKQAFGKIEAGEFGTSTAAKTALKSIGLAVSLYSTAKGISNWSKDDLVAHAKTLTSAAKLGVDGTAMVMGILGKEAVIKSMSKLGAGLNVVGGVLDVVSGIQGIAGGKIGEGTADLMSGAGGVLMAAASVSESIPGGQIPGAVLAVAGLVTKLALSHHEAVKSEEEAETDAQAYLEGGGIPKAMAEQLGNVRRDDHTNVGQAIIQLAPKLGVKPDEMMAFLLKQSPERVDAFVQMALDLSHDDSMKIPEKRVNRLDQAEIISVQGVTFTPRSLETAVEWMKANGFDPKK